MSRFLAKEGFRVECAADGQSGLELARALKPDVITLDVMMPGVDGWSVLQALKADEATVDIPVIIVTIVDDRNIGFSLGAADYFTKPIDWRRLRAVLEKYKRPDGDHAVLVVEDDERTRDLIRRNLEKEGWEVIEARDGQEGLERVAEKLPALILLDLMMPEMDGFVFMEQLRGRPNCRLVPVIVITAKDLTDADRRRLNGEVARILEKGATSAADLLAEIRSLLPANPSGPK
jgi:DNA-binding response OmpR family regulator